MTDSTNSVSTEVSESIDSLFAGVVVNLGQLHPAEASISAATGLVEVDFSGLESSFLVDVEAYGQSPFSGRLTEFGIASLASRNWLRAQVFDTIPNPANPAQPLPTGEKEVYRVTTGFGTHDLSQGREERFESLADMLLRVNEWLSEQRGNSGRTIFVSDNNGYDYSWVNYLYDSAGLPNPFGHSSRRIGDFAAGLSRVFTQTSKWKQLRDVAHTHDSHWDAQGNAGALRILLQIAKTLEQGEVSVTEAFALGRRQARARFVK